LTPMTPKINSKRKPTRMTFYTAVMVARRAFTTTLS